MTNTDGAVPVEDVDLASATPGAGEADWYWPDRYARYMVADQAGTELPT